MVREKIIVYTFFRRRPCVYAQRCIIYSDMDITMFSSLFSSTTSLIGSTSLVHSVLSIIQVIFYQEKIIHVAEHVKHFNIALVFLDSEESLVPFIVYATEQTSLLQVVMWNMYMIVLIILLFYTFSHFKRPFWNEIYK